MDYTTQLPWTLDKANRHAPWKDYFAVGYGEMKSFLRQSHPHCFGKTRVPLRRGMFWQLRAMYPQIPFAQMNRFMHVWCHSRKYRECMQSGAQRIDLYGKVRGEVTPEEAVLYGNPERRVLRLKRDSLSGSHGAPRRESQNASNALRERRAKQGT